MYQSIKLKPRGSTAGRLLLPILLAASYGASAQQPASGDVGQRIARLERIVDGQGLVELLSQVELLQNEVQQLQGRIETLNHTIDQLRGQQREIYAHLDGRLSAVEANGGLAAMPDSVTGEPPLTAMAPSAPPVVAGTPAPDNPFNVTVTTPADAAVTSDPFAVPQDVIDTVADTQQTAQQLMPPQADAPVLGVEPTMATEPATSAQAVMMPTVPATAAAVNPGQQLATPPQMTGVPIQQTGAPPVTTVTDAGLQTPTAAPIANAGRPAQVVTVDSPESEKAYGDAFNLLKSGEYEPAINALRAFLAQYPASQYVDNAQYWLGESFFVMRQFEGAIAEYQRLTQLYPDSQKYSHALLKIGYSYHELGQADLARATLEDLKERFPGSTAARLADERIQRIRLEPAR